MRALSEAEPSTFEKVRFVLTDMDETLTYQGRLAAGTYQALERLQQAGVTVIPVTAAPAGWCDQMARMWPVDGVIGENGGLFFRREGKGHGVIRRFWHDDATRPAVEGELARIVAAVKAAVPAARLADDQPFRLTSIAFTQPEDREQRQAILAALRAEGAEVTLNNLWVLGWLGGYDKLAMARRVLGGEFGLDLTVEPEAVAYVGDSTNDASMFGFFRRSVGVSTVTHYLHEIPTPPSWITAGPGGAGFVEVADALLASRVG